MTTIQILLLMVAIPAGLFFLVAAFSTPYKPAEVRVDDAMPRRK